MAEAASKTSGLGSSRIAVRATVRGAGIREPITFTMRGVVDNRGRRGRLEVDFSRAVAIGGGRGLNPADFRGEVRFRDFVLYTRLPIFRRALPGRKEWMKLDLGKAGRELGFDHGQVSQMGHGDPTQSLRYLRAVSGRTTKVGAETVRGVETTHYRATVDLRKYPSLVPPAQRPEARKSIDRLIELSGTSRVPTEVRVDARNVVRRLRTSMAFKATPGSTERGRVDQTIDLFDFGVKVRVRPPPAARVVDATRLTGAGARR